jgi:multiple sugar transport system permease protein
MPSLAFIGLFFVAPLVMAVWMSFYDWPIFGASHFIGWGNYQEMWHDRAFWQSVRYTVVYTVISTAAILFIAFPLALSVERRRPGVMLFRTAYFLPVSLGLATAATLWLLLINPNSGIISPLLAMFGLADGPVQVLLNANTATLTVVVMIVWKSVGFTMILLLIGLHAIPQELYEAARIDRAGGFAIFRKITLPLMTRTTALALILCITGGLQAFDQFYIITHGGPRNQTMTAVITIYLTSFSSYRLGYGAALSLVILLIIVSLSIVQLVVLRQRGDAR